MNSQTSTSGQKILKNSITQRHGIARKKNVQILKLSRKSWFVIFVSQISKKNTVKNKVGKSFFSTRAIFF